VVSNIQSEYTIRLYDSNIQSEYTIWIYDLDIRSGYTIPDIQSGYTVPDIRSGYTIQIYDPDIEHMYVCMEISGLEIYDACTYIHYVTSTFKKSDRLLALTH